MTTRELRETLFQVENQDMTIRELREILFNIKEEDQDSEINPINLAMITR